jgi:hypothetical protein
MQERPIRWYNLGKTSIGILEEINAKDEIIYFLQDSESTVPNQDIIKTAYNILNYTMRRLFI